MDCIFYFIFLHFQLNVTIQASNGTNSNSIFVLILNPVGAFSNIHFHLFATHEHQRNSLHLRAFFEVQCQHKPNFVAIKFARCIFIEEKLQYLENWLKYFRPLHICRPTINKCKRSLKCKECSSTYAYIYLYWKYLSAPFYTIGSYHFQWKCVSFSQILY